MVKFGLYGVEEFQKILKDLQKYGVEDTDIKRATRLGLNVIKDVARNNVPQRSGKLKKSIKVLTMKKRTARRYHFRAGSQLGPSYKMAPHAHLIEHGTAPRFRTTKNGTKVSTGSTAAKPFMKPAFRRNKNQALMAFRVSFGPAVQKRIAKSFKKYQVVV